MSQGALCLCHLAGRAGAALGPAPGSPWRADWGPSLAEAAGWLHLHWPGEGGREVAVWPAPPNPHLLAGALALFPLYSSCPFYTVALCILAG